MFNIFLILFFLFGCKTVEKIKYVEEKRMEPVFEKVIIDVENVHAEYGDITPRIMENFVRRVGYNKNKRKQCHKTTLPGNVDAQIWDICIDENSEAYKILKDAETFHGYNTEGYYIVSSNEQVDKLIDTFNYFDIEFDFFNNKYNLCHINKEGKDIYFPEIIVKNKKFNNYVPGPKDYGSLHVVMYAFDFKFNVYNKVFEIDRYTMEDKNFRIRKFRDNNGMLIFMYGDSKHTTDETPFTYKCAFHNPKIFFRNTDVFINKGFIDYFTKECECGGIYTSFGISSVKDYECNFMDLFEEGINVKINYYINQVYNMQDLFFDEYEKSPMMDWYKEKCFDISVLAAELFENINDKFFYKHSIDMFKKDEIAKSKEKIGEIASQKIIDEYELSITIVFNILNLAKKKILLSNDYRYFEDGEIVDKPNCPKLDDIIDEVIIELPKNLSNCKSYLVKIIKMFYEVMKGPQL